MAIVRGGVAAVLGVVVACADGRLVEASLAAATASARRAVALSPDRPLERFEGVEPHMGTLVSITVFAPDAEAARKAFRAGFDRIRALNETLSDYLPDSELNRVTRDAVGRPMPISADLFAVLKASQRLAVATEGAFDVTQGPVVRLWRDARKHRRLPDPEALREAAALSGHTHLNLDEQRQAVTFALPGMQLDVGAIGKGYAASEALAAVTRTGVRSALVAVSGDLAFSDAPPGQSGWRIRIHAGDIGDSAIPPIVHLVNRAVSTSGNSEQYVEVDGRRYSHVIDPASRAGLIDDITVTVVSRHGIDADGLDTAIGVLGVDRGLALVERDHEAAALIVLRKSGSTRVEASKRMRELVATQQPGR